MLDLDHNSNTLSRQVVYCVCGIGFSYQNFMWSMSNMRKECLRVLLLTAACKVGVGSQEQIQMKGSLRLGRLPHGHSEAHTSCRPYHAHCWICNASTLIDANVDPPRFPPLFLPLGSLVVCNLGTHRSCGGVCVPCLCPTRRRGAPWALHFELL